MPKSLRFGVTALLFAACTASAWPALAAPQAGAAARGADRTAVVQSPQLQVPAQMMDEQDARETSKRLNELLRRYPPALGRVLKLDPTLLSNQAYLAPYPAMAQFLAQHPEVARNSGYFLSSVDIAGNSWTPSSDEVRAKSEVINMWRNTFQDLTVVLVVATIAFGIVYLIRMLVDYRRWGRLSKVQADVHGKLLDRFTANDELLAYVQSPAGSRFLQSTPISLEPASRSMGAPFSRILWSLQAGLVLAAAGIGLQFVSWRIGFDPDIVQPLYVMGVIEVSLGIGFVLSAGVSYLLSKRLGLFEPPAGAAHGEPGNGPRV